MYHSDIEVLNVYIMGLKDVRVQVALLCLYKYIHEWEPIENATNLNVTKLYYIGTFVCSTCVECGGGG